MAWTGPAWDPDLNQLEHSIPFAQRLFHRTFIQINDREEKLSYAKPFILGDLRRSCCSNLTIAGRQPWGAKSHYVEPDNNAKMMVCKEEQRKKPNPAVFVWTPNPVILTWFFGYGSQFFFLKTNWIGFSVMCLESYQRHYYNYFFFLDSKNEHFLILSPLYSQP